MHTMFWIWIGMTVGAVADWIMYKKGLGLVENLLIAIVGAFVGGLVTNVLLIVLLTPIYPILLFDNMLSILLVLLGAFVGGVLAVFIAGISQRLRSRG